MLMASGLNFGIKPSLPHMLGICIGFPLMIIVIGLGFGAVFAAYPILHEIIKVVGITYLFYLAWRIANTRQQASSSSSSKPLKFWQSALFQWVNPKGWIMSTSALATFSSLDGDFLFQVFIIAGVFFIVSIPSTGAWLIFGTGLQKYLRQPKYLRVFNISMATLLIASIVPVILGMLT
jgi:threonine/homoserine/homoserine lactone efflux protein